MNSPFYGRDGASSANGNGHQPAPNGNGLVRAPQAPTAPEPYAPPYAMPIGAYGPGGDLTPDGSGSGVQSLRRFGQMLARRKKIIAATLLAVLAGTYFLSRSSREAFTSVATLQVISQQSGAAPTGAGDTLTVIDQLAGSSGVRDVATQLAILQSPQLLSEAMAIVPEKEQRAIQGVSMTGREGATNLIDVNVTATTKRAAEHFAMVVCKTYIDRSLNTNRSSLETATDYAREQRDKVQAKLQSSRNQLRRFQESSGIISSETQQNARLAQLDGLQTQIEQTSRDRAAANAELVKKQTQAAGIPKESYKPSQIVPNADVSAVEEKLRQLKIQRAELAQEYQETAPQIQSLDAQIRDLESQIADKPRTEIGGYQRVENPIRAALDQEIVTLQGRLSELDARQSRLRQQIGVVRSEVSRLPGLGQRLAALQSEVDTHSRDFQALNDRYTQLQMTQQAKVPDASLLFPSTPAVPVGQNRKRNLALGAVLGLVLALALAALVDWMDDRVHTEDEAKSALQLPVLAQVPMISGRESPALTQAAGPSPQLENFRMLRTLVAFSPLPSPARSVMLTSSLPGEGKSVCTANFAIAAALSGERVILIDGDLRRPTQHELFGVSNQIGFSSVALGRVSLREALIETRTPGLRLLPGGPVEANPFTLLNGAQGRGAIREAMQDADLVVIDSPPALLFADAQLLASEADAVLLVVSSRDVGRREIARTRALLAQTGTRPVGIVLNKVGGEADTHEKYAAKYYSRYNLNGQNGSRSSGDGATRAFAPTHSDDQR